MKFHDERGNLMQEIDDVIDAHGGWPSAFATFATGQPS